MLKIHAHTAFTARSGYGAHARDFFTALNKFSEVKVDDTVFGDVPLTFEQNQMVEYREGNQWPWQYGVPFNREEKWKNHKVVDIVLSTTGSGEFYQPLKGHKVAFNVWESTRQPDDFFKQLLNFDQLWVPSHWQRNVSIEQGYPPDRVIVIPEGINTSIFYPNYNKKDRNEIFTFVVFGKWEYRKSTTEILKAFIDEFKEEQDVQLILSADNPWPVDKYKTTEERLIAYGVKNPKIKVVHYLSNQDYIKTLQNSDCFLSCSRSEGWNIPLMEAIACGIPTIATNWGAPLDFCADVSLLVNIKDLRPPAHVYGFAEGTCPGEWAEPDFDHLKKRMREVYKHWSKFRKRAIKYLPKLEKFYWENIAYNANQVLYELIQKPFIINQNKYIVSFHDGAKVTIQGNDPTPVNVKFFDNEKNQLIYETNISAGFWAAPNYKYYIPWRIEVNDPIQGLNSNILNLKNERVLIIFESSALGDTIAWVPYVEKFRKQHNCHVTLRTFHNNLFKKTYPEIEFIDNTSIVSDFKATYKIGVYDNNNQRNKNNWKTIPLQRVASDILGLEYEELIPNIAYDETKKRPIPQKYVAISPAASTKAKLWNRKGGWEAVIDYLNKKGYKVMVISKEPTTFKNVIDKTGRPIEETINNIRHAEFYIGCGSGPSWLAYGLHKKVILISGFSEPWTEFLKNCYRVINKNVCHGCYNMVQHEFDRGNWEWCPEKKNFECTTAITPEMVISKINKCIEDLNVQN